MFRIVDASQFWETSLTLGFFESVLLQRQSSFYRLGTSVPVSLLVWRFFRTGLLNRLPVFYLPRVYGFVRLIPTVIVTNISIDELHSEGVGRAAIGVSLWSCSPTLTDLLNAACTTMDRAARHLRVWWHDIRLYLSYVSPVTQVMCSCFERICTLRRGGCRRIIKYGVVFPSESISHARSISVARVPFIGSALLYECAATFHRPCRRAYGICILHFGGLTWFRGRAPMLEDIVANAVGRNSQWSGISHDHDLVDRNFSHQPHARAMFN